MGYNLKVSRHVMCVMQLLTHEQYSVHNIYNPTLWFLTNHHAMKAYSSTHSLTSAPDGGEWSASHPGRFTPK
jgi:hypothetical protein